MGNYSCVVPYQKQDCSPLDIAHDDDYHRYLQNNSTKRWLPLTFFDTYRYLPISVVLCHHRMVRSKFLFCRRYRWMEQKRMLKSKLSPTLHQRITNIESKLQVIEDHIESKFQVIENYMNKTQKNTLNSDLEEIKQNTKSSMVTRRKQEKTDAANLVNTKIHTGEDEVSQLATLLQRIPIVQSLLKKNNKRGKKLNRSSGLDLSQIGDLLQNPLIQSLFSNISQNLKNDKKGKNYDGLDLSHIRNLLQNPMIQSMIKSLN
jgi:hypothetical protein